MTTLWNWQQPEWPYFEYDKSELKAIENQFLHQSGFFLGAYKHISATDKKNFIIDIISDEAFKTSEIEGEHLNRDSIQASIRRYFGLLVDHRKIPPAEHGIAEMMIDVYENFESDINHEMLFSWNKMLTNGRRDLQDIGRYRTHPEPMQIISGTLNKPKIHFEAPPSLKVPDEMEKFIQWFNQTAPNGASPLSTLSRASMAHWYFVSIHPFEDGNGRIARALAVKALSQNINQPILIALSHIIQNNKKEYYSALATNNTSNDISQYLCYFSNTIMAAQNYTQKVIDFIIEKGKLYARMRDQLNTRQEKILTKMFSDGIDKLEKGINTDLYLKITSTSRATAIRDLNDLVEKQILIRSGDHKSTRYRLNLDLGAVDISLNEVRAP